MYFNNNYLYIKYLGDGGYGRVALARDVLADRLVAIKWLKETETEKQKDIIHEIKTVANLNLPNITSFYHHFMMQKNICLVMEYCENGCLRDRLSKPILPAIALPWFEILCETIHKVHLKNIVHHDIKPDNILFTINDEIKIADFGVANRFAGTGPYMPPELIRASDPDLKDPRTDVYAMGVTLLETLTGLNPFSGKPLQERKRLIKEKQLLPGNMPVWLQNIIYRAIDPDPSLRFQTALEMAEAIRSQYVPALLDTKLIRSGNLVIKANRYLKNQKWRNAYHHLNAALTLHENNLGALRSLGQYHLLQNNIAEAGKYFGWLLKLNPRAEVQKEFGWMQLESGKYREAISLLNDYLQRNPNDTEAHNLLARCFFELGLFEQVSRYLKELSNTFPHVKCFETNYRLSVLAKHNNPNDFEDSFNEINDPFINFYRSLIKKGLKCWDGQNGPSLASKLIFREHRFEKIGSVENTVEIIVSGSDRKYFKSNEIITIGRYGYIENQIPDLSDTSISRLHCLLVNSKNDVWLYNLSQNGTIVDGEKIENKKFLYGLHQVNTGNYSLTIKTDKSLLI
jgi:tetratricopeptide (TPR) repeat protein